MSRWYVSWLLALLLTLSAAVYQRLTGPSHPLRGALVLEQGELRYRLPRSHGGEGGQEVAIALADDSYRGVLVFRRIGTTDPWSRLLMERGESGLVATLPHQPPAGKLEYFLELEHPGTPRVTVPADRTVVIRFRGAVPASVLLPHVVLMFLTMLLSCVAALEAMVRGPRVRLWTLLTCASLFLGGMILGPVVQKFAFGAYWTGVPWGWDLTDNKTLLAMILWALALALVLIRGDARARWWVVAAACGLLIIFSIPHSAMGSELDYNTGRVGTAGVDDG